MQPFVVELPSELQPWHAFQRLAHLPFVLFLDSALTHPTLGRYSWVMASPQLVFSADVDHPDPFAVLRRHCDSYLTERIPELPPFQGGLAGLFGYDLCHSVEKLPHSEIDDFPMPALVVGLYDWVIAFDHVEQRAWLLALGWPHVKEQERKECAQARIEDVQKLLDAPAGQAVPDIHAGDGVRHSLTYREALPGLPRVYSSFTREEYLQTIRRAIAYVHAGDCFQINVAQRLITPAQQNPIDLYQRLREKNAAPFAGYFDIGEATILSASPEWFLQVQDREVETRPIKGTRPVGATPDADTLIREQLLASEKDRAENVMIVDLLRNDLGRVCEYGSIKVPTVCELETYRYVHHLVSVVRGRLRKGKDCIDLLQACFPGGSITGAPKVRAMEIIAELEGIRRGAYCGSLGYLGFNGTMGSNLLIRTITHGGGWLQFPVGGGIVADSEPEAEYEETLHKAEGMLRAILCEEE